MPAPQDLVSYRFSCDQFSLAVRPSFQKTEITMQLFGDIYHTDQLPFTYSILQKSLPSIFSSECFNFEHQPFAKEVKNTEIGHLFEHILLEYFCKFKLETGFRDVVVNGLTRWDWRREKEGMFHIFIDSGFGSRITFAKALDRGIVLLQTVLTLGHSVPGDTSLRTL